MWLAGWRAAVGCQSVCMVAWDRDCWVDQSMHDVAVSHPAAAPCSRPPHQPTTPPSHPPRSVLFCNTSMFATSAARLEHLFVSGSGLMWHALAGVVPADAVMEALAAMPSLKKLVRQHRGWPSTGTKATEMCCGEAALQGCFGSFSWTSWGLLLLGRLSERLVTAVAIESSSSSHQTAVQASDPLPLFRPLWCHPLRRRSHARCCARYPHLMLRPPSHTWPLPLCLLLCADLCGPDAARGGAFGGGGATHAGPAAPLPTH